MATHEVAPRVRSLYRRFLRELPNHTPAALLAPSPLQSRIRAQVTTPPPPPSSPQPQTIPLEVRIQRAFAAADQYVQYLRAQRVYTTLLERYNPGMNTSDEDRIKLSARRVGMDLPVEIQQVLERMGPTDEGGRGGDQGGGRGKE